MKNRISFLPPLSRISLLILLPYLGIAYAEEPDDLMVVTASAIEQSIKNAPASIAVITNQQLEQDIGKASTDLADVLERVAGISKAINTDVGSGIQIRGMPAEYTLILVNGRRVGSSNGIKTTQQNYFNDINWIPIAAIERIEVVKGPMSALYGSDAMGGVVNIITKKNSTVWNGSLTAGSRQPEDSDRGATTTYSGTLGGPLSDNLSLRINGSWNKRSADDSDTSSLRWGSGLEGRKNYNYGAQLGWQINDFHQVNFSMMKGSEQNLPGQAKDSSNIDIRGVNRLERDNYTIDYQGLFDFGSVKLAAYRNKYRNTASDVPIITGGTLLGNQQTELTNEDNIIEGSINLPFDFFIPHDLTIGFQWQKEEINNARSIGSNTASPTTYGNHKNQAISRGVFAEDQLYLRDDLTLTLGARYDDTEYGEQTTPRAYLVYHPTQYLTLKGGYSEGFKAPSLRQASPGFIETSRGAGCNGYADYLGGGCYTMGNADLDPEKSKNWEVGFDLAYQGWQLGITFFDSRFKDKLATTPLGYIQGYPGRYWLERINLDTARTQGIEANLNIPLIEHPLGSWLDKLTLRNNMTRMIKAEDNQGIMLVTTPKLTTYSALDWQVNEDLGFAFSAKYYSKMLGLHSSADQAGRSSTATARIRNSYTIYGLSGHYRASKTMHFNFGIDNLFDKDPVSHDPSGSASQGNNYYVEGRTLYASMTLSF